MEKTMAFVIIPQKKIPMVDTVKKRKRGSIDEMDALILESSKSICSLSTTLKAALKTSTLLEVQKLDKSGWSPAIQGMMGSIALGLSKVPEECQMDCLISILSEINRFVKK